MPDPAEVTQTVTLRWTALIAVAVALLAVSYWFVESRVDPGGTAQAIVGLSEWLRSFGWWTPAVSLALFLVQAVVAPLPNIPIIVANGILYGPFWGAVLSWTGAMLGAAASFLVARYASHLLLRNRPRPAPIAYLDALSRRGGFWIVVVARLMPIISMDFIGLAAGVSRMRFSTYLLACAIGQAPSVLGYSILSYDAIHAEELTLRLGAIVALGLVVFVAGRWWLARNQLL